MSQAPEGPSRWSKEGRRAPPGQIGRIKLFEAAKYRLTGMAYGLMCVSQSETGVYSDSRSTRPFRKKGVAVEGVGMAASMLAFLEDMEGSSEVEGGSL